MPGVPVPFGPPSRLGGPIRRSSDLSFLAPPRRISQLGTSFVGARAEPFPRQHVSHGPVGLAHVQDAYDRYQWTLCHRRACASSGLYPFPFDARARRGCTFRLREQNGMPMVQSPGLGDFLLYVMGVFNCCLRTAHVRLSLFQRGANIHPGYATASWRQFQLDRRTQTQEFFRRHRGFRLLRVLLLSLIFVPVVATGVLLDYGELFAPPAGASRYQAALAVIVLTALALFAIVVTFALARWKEEARVTEALVAVGIAAIPIAWVAVASCFLDLKADAPTCTSGAVDIVFASMAWMFAWILAGPAVDFLRKLRRT